MSKLYEDHRPSQKDEVVGQDEAVEKFFGALESGYVRDFLFSGPSGCGKTTVARIAAKHLWGDEWEERYHEFNASDDRGINFIRNEIKELSQFSYPKIIVLDEADSMTEDAYEALRKPLESSKNTIFILCVNNLGKVLPAIISRCLLVRFNSLSKEHVWEVMLGVLEKEEITFDSSDERAEQMFERIAMLADGDLRIAIQELAAHIRINENNGSKYLYFDRPLEEEPNISYLVNAVEEALSGKLNEAICRVEDALIVTRVIPSRAVKICFDYVKELKNPVAKAEILHRLAQLDKDLNTSYPLIQYAGFLGYVWLVGSMTQEKAQ